MFLVALEKPDLSGVWEPAAFHQDAAVNLIRVFSSDGLSLMYQRVQKVDCLSPRPVLILGPLVETVKDVLVKETPAKFCRCLPGEPCLRDLSNWFKTLSEV